MYSYMAPAAPLGVCEGSLSLPLVRWLDWSLPHNTHPRCGLFSGDPNDCVGSDQPVTVDRRVAITKKQQKQDGPPIIETETEAIPAAVTFWFAALLPCSQLAS